MDPLSIIAVFAGGVTAFMGYRMFLDTLRVWGFLVLGTFGAYIATLVFPAAGGAFHLSIPLVAGILIGGVVGVIIAHPLKVVLVFLTAFLAGYLAVSTGYNMIWGGSNFLLAIGIATVLGAIAVRMEEITLIVSTSLIGAAAAIYGIVTLIGGINGLIGMIIFFLVWLFGAAAQYTDARKSSQL
jgi:hypothetical protein